MSACAYSYFYSTFLPNYLIESFFFYFLFDSGFFCLAACLYCLPAIFSDFNSPYNDQFECFRTFIRINLNVMCYHVEIYKADDPRLVANNGWAAFHNLSQKKNKEKLLRFENNLIKSMDPKIYFAKSFYRGS